MKRLVYLTFYFEPDLCAGSFRNSSLAKILAEKAKQKDVFIDLYTTIPNRYSTFQPNAKESEIIGNLRINRIKLSRHSSGIFDQIIAFGVFYKKVWTLNKEKKADIVFASSSRLFTAFLGMKIAKKDRSVLILDIRDLFVETIDGIYGGQKVFYPLLVLLKRIERKTFMYASHINLISRGFKPYFDDLNLESSYTYWTNGIDDEFLDESNNKQVTKPNKEKIIIYAGNIGEGQGLHKIIPQSARLLGNEYKFIIYGDGGAKKKLVDAIKAENTKNVILHKPVSRRDLKKIYQKADYLFIHLNKMEAFKRVLPSKIFELATYPTTILAGVSGYSNEFIKSEISDSFVFEPCDTNSLVQFLKSHKIPEFIKRDNFIKSYKREAINLKISETVLNYIK